MSVFLGLVAAVWFIAGGLALFNWLAAAPANILQQQYLTGQLLLAVVLLSFGTVFAAAAWLCDRLDGALPKLDRKPEPEPNPTPAWPAGSAASYANRHR